MTASNGGLPNCRPLSPINGLHDGQGNANDGWLQREKAPQSKLRESTSPVCRKSGGRG